MCFCVCGKEIVKRSKFVLFVFYLSQKAEQIGTCCLYSFSCLPKIYQLTKTCREITLSCRNALRNINTHIPHFLPPKHLVCSFIQFNDCLCKLHGPQSPAPIISLMHLLKVLETPHWTSSGWVITHIGFLGSCLGIRNILHISPFESFSLVFVFPFMEGQFKTWGILPPHWTPATIQISSRMKLWIPNYIWITPGICDPSPLSCLIDLLNTFDWGYLWGE